MRDIELITFTLGGRDKYLKECIESVYRNAQYGPYYIKQYIVCQGPEADIEKNKIAPLYKLSHDLSLYQMEIIKLPENVGIAEGLNRVIPRLTSPLIMKMDDDCKIVSSHFFTHAMALYKQFPNSVFSPFPVGLISNLAGPRPSGKHSVVYSGSTDTYYTKRPVTHVGGFARFSPLHVLKECKFKPDLQVGVSGNEDGQFSEYCRNNGIEMFYLENSMIVEHNESTLGQHARLGETYFKGRF